MEIVIEFKYRNKAYQYTIREDMVDMGHYDEIWDYWFGENDNEYGYYDCQDEEDELVFEVTAHKKFADDGKELISGDGLYINVYENVHEDDYIDVLRGDEINVLYQ